MSKHVIFIGWNRPIPGREKESAVVFQESLAYMAQLQQAGTIESFEPVLLNPHGGDLNGFVLVRGELAKLQSLSTDETWQKNATRSGIVVEGFGMVHGFTSEGVAEQMARWTSLLPD